MVGRAVPCAFCRIAEGETVNCLLHGGELLLQGSFEYSLDLFLRGIGQQLRQVVCHAPVGFVGCSVAQTCFMPQQSLWRGEQRPTESVFASVFVNGIDKVLGDDVSSHLQAADVGIELRAHVLSREVAGGSQFTGYHAALIAKGSQDDVLDTAFFWHGVLAAPPVVEVGPPLATDESCFAGEELAIVASSFSHDGAFPLP